MQEMSGSGLGEQPLDLALIGHGRMGAMVEGMAPRRSMRVVERFTSARPLGSDAVTAARLDRGTVLVDFSIPAAVLGTVREAARLSLDMVVGTTGWQEQREEVRRLVEEAGIGLVHGANFSLGANLFFRIVEQAAQTISGAMGYESFVLESHHRFKRDSPSGTALRLREILVEHHPGAEPTVTSLRAGYIPGRHEVGFDSPADSIHLEHRARSRQGLAEGALLAARWIAGRPGFYEFRQVLDDLHPPA